MIETTTSYIYPPRPEYNIPVESLPLFKSENWAAQLKYNGTRLLIKIKEDNSIELWNRHKRKLEAYTPTKELEEQLQSLKEIFELENENQLLDGELIHSKHPAMKHKIAVWDILVKNGTHLIGETYENRYQSIKIFSSLENFTHNGHTIGKKITEDIFIPDLIKQEDWEKEWERVKEINRPYSQPLVEGLMLKDLAGKLEHGFKEKNNSSWQIRCRVKTGRHNF